MNPDETLQQDEPSTEAKPVSRLKVPMDADAFGEWKSRVTQSESKRKNLSVKWQENVQAMAGSPLTGEVTQDTVVVNEDAPRTKAKVAQLMFQVPELTIRPRQPQFGLAAPAYAAALNFELSHNIKAQHMIDEVLTDCVNAAGLGVSKIGYDCVTRTVMVDPVLPPDLQTAVDQGLIEKPAQVEQQVPVFEEYFWKRISPAKFLWPADFTGSNWDEAPWLGFEFERPAKEARRVYGLPDTFGGTRKSGTDETLDDSEKQDVRNEETVRGIEIWYWARLFDPTVEHPKAMRRLVILDGWDEPVRHEDSPYQWTDPQTGRLLGVMKFPIRVLTLTYISDKSIPPSDSQMSRAAINEIIESRSQMVRQRRRSLPIRWYDVNAVDDDETLEQLRNGDVQDFIPVNGPGDRMIGEIARANYPRESFEFMKVVGADLDKIWSLGGNQLGGQMTDGTTAKEAEIIQGNVNVRLEYERAKVLRWFVEGAEILGLLLQKFHSDEAWVEVIGEDGKRQLQSWDRQRIAGDYVFEARPDSQLKVDVGADRMQKVRLYQMTANDPFVNRQKLVENVFRAHNIDPAQVVTQPPPKGPEPPNVSYRFSGPDLLNPIALAVMQKSGVVITAEDLAAASQLIQAALPAMAAQPVLPPTGTPPAGGPPGSPPPTPGAPGAGLVPPPPGGGLPTPHVTPLPQKPAQPLNQRHGGAAEQEKPLVAHQANGKGF